MIALACLLALAVMPAQTDRHGAYPSFVAMTDEANTWSEPQTFEDTVTVGGVAISGASFTQQKCINIDPAATTTDWLFWRTPAALTVTHVRCIVDAATSVVMTLKECNGDGASCGATEAAITCATTTTSEASSIDDAVVAANVWMRVLRGTVTGSPTQASLCMEYTTP